MSLELDALSTNGVSIMAKGVVKCFDDGKGFEFIEQSEGGPDCFVHYSDIQGTGRKTLDEGDKVEFEAQSSSKGPKAVNVRKIGTSNIERSTSNFE